MAQMKQNEVDIQGIIVTLPENVSAEKLGALATRLYQVAEDARKADRVISKRKGTIADAMLAAARDCSSVAEFNEAYNWTVIKYKAAHATKKMPLVYTQTASDIRRMFNENVDLHAKDENGETLTYSKLKANASKAKRAATSRLKKLNEDSKPEYLKEFERMTGVLASFSTDPQSDTYRAECPPIQAVNEAMQAAINDWLRQHPAAEEVEEEEIEGEVRERPEPEVARA